MSFTALTYWSTEFTGGLTYTFSPVDSLASVGGGGLVVLNQRLPGPVPPVVRFSAVVWLCSVSRLRCWNWDFPIIVVFYLNLCGHNLSVLLQPAFMRLLEEIYTPANLSQVTDVLTNTVNSSQQTEVFNTTCADIRPKVFSCLRNNRFCPEPYCSRLLCFNT